MAKDIDASITNIDKFPQFIKTAAVNINKKFTYGFSLAFTQNLLLILHFGF